MIVRVVPNRYVDSVRLMKVAQGVRSRDGVRACELVMGTPANLQQLGVSVEATPADVVIAVDGPEEALDAAERELSATAESREVVEAAPRSLATADGNVALISVPGEYATLEAHRALTRDMHVFLFSDHVSVEDEIALKRRGAERGRLVMGPECGTAMLGGIGLGFANVVRRGPVGIVAAAGTGAQEASVLLDRSGSGVSQIIGVGGRDLSAEVGGIMFRQGMELLAADDETETLLLVSKPPDAEAVRALGDVDTGGKRVVAAFVGWDGGEAPFEVHPTLEAGAFAAAAPFTRRGYVPPGHTPGACRPGACPRARPVLRRLARATRRRPSSVPATGSSTSARRSTRRAARTRWSTSSCAGGCCARRDRGAGCVLLDVVLGHGSHADPAGELAETLAELAREPGDRARVRHERGPAGRRGGRRRRCARRA